ncbi:MAG TPA: MFS transporter, partial [Actinoplanes sp.]|nr:MFS transporter [Actinoplanes sp.]
MRRNAALLVLISVLSGFGGTALTLAAGIWILDLTGNPGLAALAALGVYLPSLAAPWLGALVDRFPRRALLITVEFVVAALLLVLLPVDTAGQVWLIYLVMLARGFGYVLLDAGETALLPSV